MGPFAPPGHSVPPFPGDVCGTIARTLAARRRSGPGRIGADTGMKMKWWCAVAVLLIPVPSGAGGGTAGRIDKPAARRLVEKGTRALRQKRYHEAIRCFKEAYRHWPRPEIDHNLALVYLEAGNRVAAATHLRRYLGQTPAEEKATVAPRLRRVLREVGVLAIRVPSTRVFVWVDGKKAGRGSVEVVVRPGPRVVEIRDGGRILHRTVMDVSAGQVVRWSVVGAAWVVPPGGRKGKGAVAVDRRSRWARLHWGYFAAAAALALVAGASIIGTGVKTESLADEYNRNESPALEKKFKRYKLATNALIGVAATAAAAAAALAVFTRWRRGKEPKASAVMPELTPQGLSFSF